MALSTLQYRCRSGSDRRDVVRCRRTNPYGSLNVRRNPPWAASRDAVRDRSSGNPPLVPRYGRLGFTARSCRRGGPIGVVKLLRARGGCLGVIRFGRGRLRKVRGSCPTSVEPGIPEQTRGTETSQYPEDQKSTETPSVAASERGPAQTGGDTPPGSWGRQASDSDRQPKPVGKRHRSGRASRRQRRNLRESVPE